jgi:hypothetical protein
MLFLIMRTGWLDFSKVRANRGGCFQAATDSTDKLSYVAGLDAQAMFVQRKQVGDEAFRKGVEQMFFGN